MGKLWNGEAGPDVEPRNVSATQALIRTPMPESLGGSGLLGPPPGMDPNGPALPTSNEMCLAHQ